ncbi:His Kinase A (phospho-acceptor) domain-containing protein [Fodinibius roseus]|uniref:histidine kinase n=1 Tax=Fodinibius roseus TaxID=1194090 RepID=A0A1M5HH66_9BACT|nr:HAMP domain-containing sensor histidine kinase [Fodinibius roseus]SHG15267.1 His Kinase A (phospho-acceptor) domain-containing protein [Fodinibius roseus]
MNKHAGSDPAFIIEMNNRIIRDVNEAAITGCDRYNPIGKNLEQIIYVVKDVGNAISPAYFNGLWYTLQQETLIWEGTPHIKITLQHREEIPDNETLHSLKNMIGFLLHRIRSPLTGMQGYAHMAEGQLGNTSSAKYLRKINAGIENLFDLLDDLESLQEISLKEIEVNNYSAETVPIIKEIISEYPPEIQQRITFLYSAENEQLLRCSPADLRRILTELIDNAVDHAPAKDGNNITIELPSDQAVKISHDGNLIPKSIARQLFFPFVTGKATKLGIGLTMAILYAKRYKGTIFLTDNNPFRGVSFTFCLPPSDPSTSSSLL